MKNQNTKNELFGVPKKENFNKYALSPCYIKYDSKLEEDFAKFIDLSEKVVWWYKNGDNYGKYLGILYTSDGKERTFYPDFIIKTVEKVWIIDTKSGLITQEAFRSGKVEALTNWLERNPECDGGIVVRDGDIWKIHRRIAQNEEIIDELVGESNINYYPKRKLEL